MGLSEADPTSLLIDEKLLMYMDHLELLEQKRADLNSLIEQGWFSISKARYSMGNKQVSALQFASEMEPLVCVQARTRENGTAEFSTERILPKYADGGNDVMPVKDIGPKEEGVRRRIKSNKDVAGTEESDSSVPSKNTSTDTEASDVSPPANREQPSQRDPLKWFGILVPQTLKQAQSSFKQVIELSAEIASLQDAVLKSSEELKLSMKPKQTKTDELTDSELKHLTEI